ncbi:helix-turn-helix domain-containing protein [Haloglycomyces albus]|uniref:helix-turn-helix domain-containing protein n=1 Tax=Haloglycomyces albus TaxID=526067 RepID=UPI00046CC5D1|nr:helix-turn-helix transcriptional regulator [Haloglycomyces albus]
MATFPETLRRLRSERGLSQSGLAQRSGWSRQYIGFWETGKHAPSGQQVQDLDKALRAKGELIGVAHLDNIDAQDMRPLETVELLDRLRSRDTSTQTLDQLEATVFELCCRYKNTPAPTLRAETQQVITEASGLLQRPIGLREHRELLVSAGWLALLSGCLEYDMGLRRGAEATRRAARDLAKEAGHREIEAWSFEMSAWFNLTQGRYRDVLTETKAGLGVGRNYYVSAQLLSQEAKALARLGNAQQVRTALDASRQVVESMSIPDRTDHHFVVDPAKHNFYAMDTYRLAGADTLASSHAYEVLRQGTGRSGEDLSPMRMAEARLTLGVVAAHQGEAQEAHALGVQALEGARKSLPSLVMVAAELESALDECSPALAEDYTARIESLRE